jgi:lipopolysaccharide export system protein LptC
LTTAYPVDGARGVTYSANSRSDTERIYRLARRHSRYVRWLRLGVPAGLALALLTVAVANYIPPVGGFRLPGELGKLVINGTKITMDQPRLTGFTADSRPYEFTANTAAQDITNPDFMELKQLRAKIKMQDDSTVDMSAASGSYDIKGEMLTLHDDVHLVSSTGYEARLSEAVVDMRKGGVVSEKPVWVKLLNGFLNAKRLEVVDNGNLLRFDGGVAMTLHPDKISTKATEP